MNFTRLLRAATLGKTQLLRPLIGWTLLEYALRGAPYGVLLFVVFELFLPLQHPGTSLRLERIGWLCLGLLASLALLFVVGRKAYGACFTEAYRIGVMGRLAIADQLRKLPMSFYCSRDPGDLGAYLVQDYAGVENIVSHIFPQIVGGFAMSGVLLLFLAFLDWRLASIALLVIVLTYPVLLLARRVVSRVGGRLQDVRRESTFRIIEFIQGICVIKAFNAGGMHFERMREVLEKLRRSSIAMEASIGPVVLGGSIVLHAGTTLLILQGADFLERGIISIPVYLAFLILGARVFEPLMQGLVFLAELNYNSLGVERIRSLMATPTPEVGSVSLPGTAGDIAFSHVTFSYLEKPVLKDVSFTLPSRAMTAFVGPSGSGKTTITRLLARFWDADQGRITVGGTDIRDIPLEGLLSQLSVVFQDVYLFQDTVRNNIAMARPEATQEEVEHAARVAHCHDFILSLPKGYDTMLGERGNTLSGGEKQRISIARALLKDAPVILLDEATAALDPENEIYIQEALDRLVEDKTVVVIAHRLNTIVEADHIIVLDDGMIVQQGKHNRLMQENGLYRRLWDEQQKFKSWKFS
ncbi:MAG TPA: ABC transporter ATP-binding protein [Solidesulfovibrio sp.]|nr:ABC transporter ATP-binding protein [Solidesulfovibrio sp.]